MGTFSGYLKYNNPDWTQSINKRTKTAWVKGIWTGAEVTPVGGNMDVYIGSPFVAHSKDGLVVYYEGTNAQVTIPTPPIDTNYFILLHSYYVGGSNPIMEFEVMKDTVYNGISNQDDYLIIATVVLLSGATFIVTDNIHYKDRDSIDIVRRLEFRGSVLNIGSLPTDKNNRDGDIWSVFDSSSSIAPKLLLWNDNTKAWVDIHDSTTSDTLFQHRNNFFTNEKHLTDNEYLAVTNAVPSGLDATNHLVGASLPLAKNDSAFYDLSGTPATYVTMAGLDVYVGTGVVGTAKRFFKLVVPNTLGNLTGTDGGIILVDAIYDSTNTVQLNPVVDAPNGYYNSPTVRLDMSGTAMVNFNGTMDIIYGSATDLGSLTGEDLLLAGQVNDFRPAASGVNVYTGAMNIFTTPTNQQEFDQAVDDFLYPPIEYDLSASTDNKLLVLTNTLGSPAYAMTQFSNYQVINNVTVTGTDTVEYFLAQYATGVPPVKGLLYISQLNGSSVDEYFMITGVTITGVGFDSQVELTLVNMNDVNPNFTLGHIGTGYLVSGQYIKNDGTGQGITIQKARKASSGSMLSLRMNRPVTYSGVTVERNVVEISDYQSTVFSITDYGSITHFGNYRQYDDGIFYKAGGIFEVHNDGDDSSFETEGGHFTVDSDGGDIRLETNSGEFIVGSSNGLMEFDSGSSVINFYSTVGIETDCDVKADSFSLNSRRNKLVNLLPNDMIWSDNSGGSPVFNSQGLLEFNASINEQIWIRVPFQAQDRLDDFIFYMLYITNLTGVNTIDLELYVQTNNPVPGTHAWAPVAGTLRSYTDANLGGTTGTVKALSLNSGGLPVINASNPDPLSWPLGSSIYAVKVTTTDNSGGLLFRATSSRWNIGVSDPELGLL